MRTIFAVFMLFSLASGCGIDPKTDIEPMAWWQDQLKAAVAKNPPTDRSREQKLWQKFVERGVVHQATRTAYPNGLMGG